MNTEIQFLAATGGLALVLTLFQGTRNVIALGLVTAAGNQEDIAPWTGWNDRLNRALRNLIEAIVVYAPIAIAVHELGVSNETSALGAAPKATRAKRRDPSCCRQCPGKNRQRKIR